MGTRAWIGVAAAVAVCAVGLWAFWDLTIDDAYITFRYSQHLAEGHGPVWNIDHDPVQGYTNLLWMLLLTPPAWLGWSLPVTAKVLGIIALAGTLWQVHVAAVDWSGRRAAGVAAVAALLLLVPTYVHTVAGLETMLYAGLLLRFVWSVTADRSPWERAVLAVVVGMVRPEGWAVAGAGMLYVTWRDRGPVLPLLASGAGVTAVVGWQWWFYGSPVSNTFYVKTGQAVESQSLRTIVLVVGVASVLWLLSSAGRDRVWVVAALMVAVAPYLVSDLMMDYAMRFAYHVIPLAVAAAVAAAFRVRHARPAIAAGSVCVLLLVLGVMTVPPRIALYGPTLQRAHVALGQALAPLANDGVTLAAGDAGAIPFYSGLATLDTLGLNDEQLARGVPLHERVGQFRPDVIVGYKGPPSEVHVMGGRGRSLGLTEDGYELLGTVQFRGTYRLVVVVSRTLAADQRLMVGEAVATPRGFEEPMSWSTWMDHLARRLSS